ncbi:Asp-tRNAAsn/Glu-tRNAGln amidotransferase A subunit [Enhydrobacter aerosaccus]|uniref:Asp-tRNAAsn/Glu-tRNAGln amidotransferase A subunit n=1 Tax=Enhydrobacter aerosaccus TaxID=225324 RepID=A0A1T4MSM8_9HYPH|nr:amidase [Enhydrobacter aerosaccus]SJZ69804.1 Asp-tRNAAsn/Glu-tRNAGln amidotransferase A subunit [Enhydrobacter aerosaccus]
MTTCSKRSSVKGPAMIDRRSLLACGSAVTATVLFTGAEASPGSTAAPPDIYGLDATALQQMLTRGETTSVGLVISYLQRIAAYEFAYGDQLGINAISNLNANALAEARQRDEEKAQGKQRGPLHGIPILVKDVVDVRGLPTTGSLEALRNFVPAEDATQIRLLREAGAIVLGKTNVLGVDGRGAGSFGGDTRNPYDQSRHPGFSSGGAAAAVAAGFAPISIAEDTFGSIRIPASLTNLVGLRPTIGLTSANGLQRLTWTYDTLGPIALSVRDIALVLDATVRPDRKDPVSAKDAAVPAGGYGRFLDVGFLRGKRLGVIGALFASGTPAQVATSEAVRSALAEMERQGATIVEATLPADMMQVYGTIGRKIISYEIPKALNAYFGTTVGANAGLAALAPPSDRITRADLLVYSGEINASDTDATTRADESSVSEADYKDALAAAEKYKRLLVRYMVDNHFDALAYPSMQQPASKIGVSDPFDQEKLAATAGFPALSLPAGFVEGLPVGIELMGLPFTEAKLLGMGYAFEQATQHRKLPATTPALMTGQVSRR